MSYTDRLVPKGKRLDKIISEAQKKRRLMKQKMPLDILFTPERENH